MKYTLIRDGKNCELKAGNKTVATWDRFDPYDYVLKMAQRIAGENELVETTKGAQAKPEDKVVTTAVEGGDADPSGEGDDWED